MKFLSLSHLEADRRSLPTRGAWIEMSTPLVMLPQCRGRSPHGERGLKSGASAALEHQIGRSPHGERGLKSGYAPLPQAVYHVAPHTGSVD